MSEGSPHWRVLSQAVAANCVAGGWDSAEAEALALLTNRLRLFLKAVGRSSRLLAEQCGRADVVPSDVSVALVEAGCLPHAIADELADAVRSGKTLIPPPKPATGRPESTKALQIGRSRPKSSHYPDFLPPFPDPHTYIQTQIRSDDELSHLEARTRAATAEREAQAALIAFLVRTNASIPLYPGQATPAVLVPERETLPYLSALLPPTGTLDEATAEEGGSDAPRASESAENPYLAQPRLPTAAAAAPIDVTEDLGLIRGQGEPMEAEV